MKTSNLITLFVFLSSSYFVYFAKSELIGADATKIEEWHRIIYRLYDTKEPQLNQNEMLKLMQRALEIFEDLRWKKEAISLLKLQHRVIEMKDLIDLHKSVGSNCDLKSFTKFYQASKLYGHYYQHINPFIKQNRYKHFKVCRPEIISNLKKGVSSLAPETKETLQRLSDKIFEFGGDYFNPYIYIPNSALKQGLKAYLETQAGRASSFNTKLRDDKGRRNLEKQYGDVIMDINFACLMVDDAIGSVVNIYDERGYDCELRNLMDSFEIEWLAKGQVCKNVLQIWPSNFAQPIKRAKERKRKGINFLFKISSLLK